MRHKYKWSFYLLICYIIIDVSVHKGLMCVLFSGKFKGIVAVTELPACSNSLLTKRGRWKKGVNTIESIPDHLNQYIGLELDVYFDAEKRSFIAFHDSAEKKRTDIRKILKILQEKKYEGALWLDFKNLSDTNQESALNCLIAYSISNNLKSRIIVESNQPKLLMPFCREGFFTSYYVPYFNPYLMNQSTRSEMANMITGQIRTYAPSALSGYYFQYPFLKSCFPKMSLLTWTENHRWSLVNYFFQHKIRRDSSLLIILEY